MKVIPTQFLLILALALTLLLGLPKANAQAVKQKKEVITKPAPPKPPRVSKQHVKIIKMKDGKTEIIEKDTINEELESFNFEFLDSLMIMIKHDSIARKYSEQEIRIRNYNYSEQEIEAELGKLDIMLMKFDSNLAQLDMRTPNIEKEMYHPRKQHKERKIIHLKPTLENIQAGEALPSKADNSIKKDLEIEALDFYANPRIFKLNFKLPEKGNLSIKMIDIDADKVVYEENLKNFVGKYNKDVDLSKDEGHNYLIQIIQKDKKILKKIVIH